MAKIRVIIKEPGEAVGEEVWIINSLRSLQKIVGGSIGIDTLANGSDRIVVVTDADGKLKNLTPNFRIETMERIDVIVGTAIICGANDGGDLVSLPFDLATWRRMLRRWGNE